MFLAIFKTVTQWSNIRKLTKVKIQPNRVQYLNISKFLLPLHGGKKWDHCEGLHHSKMNTNRAVVLWNNIIEDFCSVLVSRAINRGLLYIDVLAQGKLSMIERGKEGNEQRTKKKICPSAHHQRAYCTYDDWRPATVFHNLIASQPLLALWAAYSTT